jgi:hypothetical protein
MLTNCRQNRAPPKAANKQAASRPRLSAYQKLKIGTVVGSTAQNGKTKSLNEGHLASEKK